MGQDRLTLLDIARQADPDGKPAKVIEVLNEMNPILQDAPAFEGNAPMGNRVTLRSSLPTVAWGKVNQGVTKSKGSTRQVVDTMGLLAGLSEVDSKLKKIVGAAKFDAARWNEDQGFLEAMSQEVANTIFYGDEDTDESVFTGLAPRMSSLATAISSSQVVAYQASDSDDLTSCYVVDWGERACKLIYPENSVAGVDVRDLGEMRVTDRDGAAMMAYVTAYDWLVGLSVEDPRHIARLCNIDRSAAATDTSFTLGLKLIDVLNSMPEQGGAQRIIYTHRDVVASFFKQAINKSNAALSIRDYLGKPTPHFWDVPIRRCDQIAADEGAPIT